MLLLPCRGPVTGEVVSSGGSASSSEAASDSSSVALAADAAAPQAAPTAAPQRTGLLCSLWHAYCDALKTSPLPTKIYTGILGTLLGDLAAQVLSHQQQAAAAGARRSSGGGCAAGMRHASGFRFNALRTGRLCLYSALIGTPMGLLELEWLDAHVMPGSPGAPAAIAAKVCLDQLVQTPFGMALFLAVMKALEGHWRPVELRHELQAKVRARVHARSTVCRLLGTQVAAVLLHGSNARPCCCPCSLHTQMAPALLANYKLWPAAQLVSFALIPQEQRILYGNVVGIVWTVIISNMQQAGNEAPTAAEPVAGADVQSQPAVEAAAPARAASTMPA